MSSEAEPKPMTKQDKYHLVTSDTEIGDEFNAVYEDGLVQIWWKCLRESEDYARAQAGELGEPYASVARDFGELGTDFIVWWVDTGRFLFAGQFHQPSVRMVPDAEPRSTNSSTLYMSFEVPLILDRRSILKQIEALVDAQLQQNAETADALKRSRRQFYPNQRMRKATISKMLEVWEARKDSAHEWWEIGEKCKVSDQFDLLPDDDTDAVKHKRRMLAMESQRLHRSAAALISFAAQGDFPRIK